MNLSAWPLGSREGAPMGYLEYLPPGYGDGTPRPLLLFFHGSAESGDGSAAQLPGLEETGIPRVIARDSWPADRPFVVLMPQHDAHLGGPCTTGAQVAAMIAFALDGYQVDPARVYITGLSCGAIGGWEYLGVHTDEAVAAAVLIAGDGRDAVDAAGCTLGRVPIWAIHGGADQSVDPGGSIVPINSLNECTDPLPVDARLSVYPGVGHAIWQPFYDGTKRDIDIYDWMLGYANPPGTP